MQLKFNKAKWSLDSEGCWLSILVQNRPAVQQFVATKKDKLYSAELKEYRERRSLDANAYAWLLIGKLADALTLEASGATAYNKDDVYRLMLKRYGQGGVVKIPNSQVDNFRRAWKYNEKHESLPDEEKAQYFRFWVGSSEYNTQEMAIFINGIVSECKEQGIETATPEELARMKEEWH